ncbi:MAG: calcium-binding protein [Maritimibacter sp.]|nr:calcium-binding protein [Maritimibacter sp.]
MGVEVITSNLTSQYGIDAQDFVVLTEGVSLIVTADATPGFLANHDQNCSLTVLGTVITNGKSVVMGQNGSSGVFASLELGDTGRLQALTDVAVEVRRSGSILNNAGDISGGGGGISYVYPVTGGYVTNTGTIWSSQGAGITAAGESGVNVGTFTIVNAGRIEGYTNGISISFENLTLTNSGQIVGRTYGVRVVSDPALANNLKLTNDGLIQGATAAILGTGSADSVTNRGEILGDVQLGAGDNSFDNGGTTDGAVSGGAGADVLRNAGRITKAASLGDGANVVTNDGQLASLATGTGADRFTNGLTGVVTGSVALGDGANIVTNLGVLAAGLSLGTGDDTLVSTGSILGAVLLGDGANGVTNEGRLASLAAGSGADELTNRLTGVVTGSVDLGDGANTVTNLGTLMAGVSLGAGDDTLVSTGALYGDVALGDGANSAEIDGLLQGDLSGGGAVDTVLLLGAVRGDIALGGGDDALRIKSAFIGAVDMGAGEDYVYLGTGAGELDGTLDGGADADRIVARTDIDSAVNFETLELRGNGDHAITGDGIANLIRGNRGNNTLDGGGGADEISGKGGDDVLVGGDGDDTIYGGYGADAIHGGAGLDDLYGGTGADVFLFEQVSDSPDAARDRILDFDRGRDHVDLTALVDGPIVWLGKAKFTAGGQAEARYLVKSGTVKLLVDVDGDGVTDLGVMIPDIGGFGSGDLYL